MEALRRRTDRIEIDDIGEHTPVVDIHRQRNIALASEAIAKTQEKEIFYGFHVGELNGDIHATNLKIQMGDVVVLHFQRSLKEMEVNVTLKFYVSRNYSNKIVGFFKITDNNKNISSRMISGEIKYAKIPGKSRNILEEVEGEVDALFSIFKKYLNEAILQNITIYKEISQIPKVEIYKYKALRLLKK